jgi:putative intracellular protease/amidase
MTASPRLPAAMVRLAPSAEAEATPAELNHMLELAVARGARSAGFNTPGGKPLVADRTVTAFSDAEEDAAGTRDASPFSLQEELAGLGATVEVTAPFTVNGRRDGNLVTGQNPMSSAARRARGDRRRR